MSLKKSIVLLSSGLDSTVNFCKALKETEIVLSLTFDYGQRAAKNEISHAKRICEKYVVSHRAIELDWLGEITKTSLVNRESELPRLSKEELNEAGATQKSAAAVWVPNRNGVFIHIAAAMAEATGAEFIVVGFNAEEAVTFPDNSAEFIERINLGLEYSTRSKPRVICYTKDLNKREIVQLGRELNAPFEWMWSCYESGKEMCRQCESCLRFERAMEWCHSERSRHPERSEGSQR